jgi:hypothetical protein
VSTPDEVAYCTRELVQATLDQADRRRLNTRIDAACRAGARDLEGILHRRFFPVYGTRYPDPSWITGDTLWLNHMDYEVQSIVTLTADSVELVDGTDYYLEWPGADGSPYTAVRLYRDSSASWPVDQRDLSLLGYFGGHHSVAAAGTLAAAISSTSATTMTVSDSSLLGVCDMVKVDSEQVVITGKTMTSTTATLTGAVTDEESATTIPVSSGALVNAGEMILVGSERMFVEDVVGNNLIVQRATEASVLAAHSTSDVVYAPRVCTITRGVAGTTAATHLTASALSRNKPPASVVEANLALAINYVEQGKSGYARTAGVGDNRRESGGTGRQGRIGVC